MHDDSTHVPHVPHEVEELAGKTETGAKTNNPASRPRGEKVRAMLRARFGEEVYGSWFRTLEFDNFDGRTVRASVPVKFLQTWIQAHYADGLLECCKAEFSGAERLEVVVREFGTANGRAAETAAMAAANGRSKAPVPAEAGTAAPRRVAVGPGPALTRTNVNGFEGSPLDPKYTFDSFVEGKANRIAHAVAAQVAADGAGRSASVQPALPALSSRARQDASPARHRLGGEAASSQGTGALSDGRALPLPVRGGCAQPGRNGVQGQVPGDRHPADRRPGVHAGREDRAGVRAHHQRPARRRQAGGGGLCPASGPARPPQRSHALAHAARPHHRDRRVRRGAAAQDPRAARAGEARDATRRSSSRRPCSSCWPSG